MHLDNAVRQSRQVVVPTTLIFFSLVATTGCIKSASDGAGSTTGPTIVVHCQQVGDTKVTVHCSPPE
jgi:hypothetical protein